MYGNSASGVNSVEYLKNCFENTAEFSIEVNEGASIELQQGEFEDAAGNCFFASGRVGTGQTSEFFDYYVKQGEVPQSCKKPGSGNFYEKQAFSDELIPCGTGINIYGSLPYIVRNCMYGNGITKQQAIAYLSAQELFSHKIMAFALIAESGDLIRASAYLNTLPTRTNAELGFVEAQRIYLSSLLLRQNFVLSVTDRISLENIAKSENELSGYARTIYYLLTGQRIQVDLPHLRPVIPRTKSDSQSEATEIIKAYPNPVAGSEYFIDIPHNENTNHYVIQLSDLSGRELVNQKGNPGVNSLIIDQCASGVYILKVTKNGSKVMTQKVVRL